jgi:hypothetical protein
LELRAAAKELARAKAKGKGKAKHVKTQKLTKKALNILTQQEHRGATDLAAAEAGHKTKKAAAKVRAKRFTTAAQAAEDTANSKAKRSAADALAAERSANALAADAAAAVAGANAKGKAKCTAGLAAAERVTKMHRTAGREVWNRECSAVFNSEFGRDLPKNERFKACTTEASRLRAVAVSVVYGCSKCRHGPTGCKACNPAKQALHMQRSVAAPVAAVAPAALRAARAAAEAAADVAAAAAKDAAGWRISESVGRGRNNSRA